MSGYQIPQAIMLFSMVYSIKQHTEIKESHILQAAESIEVEDEDDFAEYNRSIRSYEEAKPR